MTTPASSCRLAVDSDDGIFTVTAHQASTYQVHLGDGLTTGALSSHLDALASHLEVTEIGVLIDAGVAENHLGNITAAVTRTGLPLRIIRVEAGQDSTSSDSLNTLIRALPPRPWTRRTLLLAVGGGSVHNLVRTAAGYLQGLPYALVPTTVQAQIDAGAGPDYGLAADRLGTPYPAGVYVDPTLTATLPDQHITAGLAEAIKVALVTNPLLFATLEKSTGPRPAGPVLTTIVCEAMGSKLLLRALNPQRELLQLGHCVGGAYTAALRYRIPHGEAVAVGIAVAAAHAFLSGKSTLEHRERILDLLAAYRLPVAIPDEIRDPVWACVAASGRLRNGYLRLILPLRPGRCAFTDDFDRSAFDKAVDDLAARP